MYNASVHTIVVNNSATQSLHGVLLHMASAHLRGRDGHGVHSLVLYSSLTLHLHMYRHMHHHPSTREGTHPFLNWTNGVCGDMHSRPYRSITQNAFTQGRAREV